MSHQGITWLASYPRSGNTWIRLLLAHALGKEGAEIDLNALPFANISRSRQVVDDILGFESADLPEEQIQSMWPEVCRHIADTHPVPLFIKSHARWPDQPTQRKTLLRATAGVVLIVRHPADVAISLSHFFGLSLDRAIEILADPAFCYNHPPGGMMETLPEWSGSWSTHLMSWLESGVPLHLVKYEELSADPETALQGILSFAGLSVSPTSLQQAKQHTALPHLQKSESKHGFREAPTDQRAFFRAGTVGRARSILTQAQLDSLTRSHGRAMELVNYF